MAHREVIATRTGRYGTRMLTAGEPLLLSGPAARAMIALGRAEPKPARKVARRLTAESGADLVSLPEGSSVAQADDITTLRAEYHEKLGKRPFPGWSADILREKIAEA